MVNKEHQKNKVNNSYDLQGFTQIFKAGVTRNQRSAFWLKPLFGFGIMIIWVILSSTVLRTANSSGLKLMANALLGLALGYVLQRSFFGYAGAVKRTSQGSSKLSYAVLTIFAFGAILVAILVSFNGSIFNDGNLLKPRTISIGTLFGSIIFGIGMILAKGCASGNLTDFSTGSSLVLISFVFFIIGAGPGQILQGMIYNSETSLAVPGISLIKQLGIAAAIIVTLLFIAAMGLASFIISKKVRAYKNIQDVKTAEKLMGERDHEKFEEWCAQNGVTTNDSKTWWVKKYFLFFAKKINLFLGAFLILAILMGLIFVNKKGWGVTTSMARWFGWIFNYHYGPDNLITKHQSLGIMHDSGSWRNFGIMIGAIAYMFMSNKFRMPKDYVNQRPKQIFLKVVMAILGGFFLGFGARLAEGCNAGQLTTGLMTFSLSAWLFAVGMIIGGVIGVYIIKVLKRKHDVRI